MVQEHRSLRLAVALAAALMLAGCPAPAPRPSPQSLPLPVPPAVPPSRPLPAPAPPPSAPSPSSSTRPPAPARENRLSPATQSLVTQARTLTAHGDLDSASSTLDRALRIEPNNPLLWIELGRLRIAESDAHQAEGCARKALALASGDPHAQKQAGKLLADALRGQQRNQEAHEVESQPYMN